MKNKLIRILPLVLLAAGCTREMMDPLTENRSRAVDFQFSTHYTQEGLLTKASDNLFDTSATKTVFSGKDQNGQDVTSSSTKERIDWEVGDKVDLMVYKGDQEYKHTYEIKAFKTEGNLESQSTSVSSDESFTFKGGGDYYFFATYPSRSIGKALKKGNGYDYGLWKNGSTSAGFGLHMPNNLTCSITEKNGRYVVMDDMDYAVMTAGKFVSNMTSPQSIEMELTPFFNAYQLILTNTEATASYKLEKLTISCTDGYLRTQAGADKRMPSTIRFSGGKVETIGNDGYNNGIKTITYDFTQVSGFSQGIPFNKPLDITLLALPLAQKGLSFTFTFNGGVTRTLELDQNFTLRPSHKMRIYNIGYENEEWIYVLEVTPGPIMNPGDASTTYRVRSYKFYVDGNGTRHERPVAWKTQINLGSRTNENQTDWRDITNASYTPDNDRLPGGWVRFPVTSDGSGRTLSSGDWESRTVNASSKIIEITSDDPDSYHQKSMGARMHPSGINNLFSKDNAIDLSMYDITGMSVANRSTANCYVVKGAGWYKIPLVYGNGIKNGASNVSGNASFKDHNGNTITQAWIKDQTGISNLTGTLVWTDFWDTEHNHGIVCDVQVQDNFLLFRIPQESIRPGNSVIAVKGNGMILWSWHIWVTDQEITADANGYMTANIGWVDMSTGSGYYHPARAEMLRVVQYESNKTADFSIQQKGHDFYTNKQFRYGKYTYFQWGRKDPIIASKSRGEAGNNPVWGPNGGDPLIDTLNIMLTGPGGNPIFYTTFSEVKESILNPMTMHLSNGGTLFPGGWSQNSKTLYDPSPLGFRVMPNGTDFFTRYRNTNPNYLKIYNDDRYTWYPGGYLFDGFFLSACGYRNGRTAGGGNQPSALVAAAGVNKDQYISKATIWTAQGPIIIRFDYGQGYYIVNSGVSGGSDSEPANAHAIRPIRDN